MNDIDINAELNSIDFKKLLQEIEELKIDILPLSELDILKDIDILPLNESDILQGLEEIKKEYEKKYI